MLHQEIDDAPTQEPEPRGVVLEIDTLEPTIHCMERRRADAVHEPPATAIFVFREDHVGPCGRSLNQFRQELGVLAQRIEYGHVVAERALDASPRRGIEVDFLREAKDL